MKTCSIMEKVLLTGLAISVQMQGFPIMLYVIKKVFAGTEAVYEHSFYNIYCVFRTSSEKTVKGYTASQHICRTYQGSRPTVNPKSLLSCTSFRKRPKRMLFRRASMGRQNEASGKPSTWFPLGSARISEPIGDACSAQ